MSTTRVLSAVSPNFISITPPMGDFQPEISTAALEAAKSFLTHNGGFHRVGNFAGITEKGLIDTRTGGACHSAISSFDTPYRYAVATECGWNRQYSDGSPKKDAETVTPFLEWFLYHSPYGHFIANRDDFDFCLNNGFIVSGKMPRKLLQNIMIITRHFYEITRKTFEEFNDAVLNRGIDPLVAYSTLFNSGFSYSSTNESTTKYCLTQIYQGYNGHRVQRAYNPEELVRIARNKPLWPLNETYEDRASIRGGSALWCKMSDPSYTGEGDAYTTSAVPGLCAMRKEYSCLDNAIKTHRGEAPTNTKIYHPPNPFKVSSSAHEERIKTTKFTNDEAIKVVLPWLDKKVKELLSNVAHPA